MSEPLMRRPEAAVYLGVAKSFLDKAACAGNGPKMVRLATKAVAYRRSDLDEWIESRIVSSTSESLPN